MAPEHTASVLDRFAKATHKLSFSILPPTLEAPLELNSPSAGSCDSQLFLDLCTLTGGGVYGGLESLSLVLRFLSPMAEVLLGGEGGFLSVPCFVSALPRPAFLSWWHPHRGPCPPEAG